MNLKKLAMGAAIAASVVGGSLAATSPAEALVIGGVSVYSSLNSLPTTLTVNNEFSNGDLTGGFTNVSGIQVGALGVNAGSSVGAPLNANYNPTLSFLTNFQYAGQNAVLNLLAGEQVIHTIATLGSATFVSTVDYNFVGEIRSLGGSLLGNATGGFSANRSERSGRLISSNFSLDVNATPVPTPALLPALLGMGAAALRKRKGEGSEAEKETVGVKA